MIFKKLILIYFAISSYVYSQRTNCNLNDNYIISQSQQQKSEVGDVSQITGPKTDNAYLFGGLNGYIDYSDITFGGNTSIQFSCRFDQYNSYSRIFEFNNDTQNQDLIVIYNESTTSDLTVMAYNTGIKYFSTYRNIGINQEHHYLAIFYNDHCDFYQDNNLLPPFNTGNSNTQGIKNTLRNKVYQGNEKFKGMIDELTVFNYVVSEKQRECIFDICNPGFSYCSQCTGDSDNCTQCEGNRLVSSDCQCPVDTYDLGQALCCNFQCLDCTITSDNCGTCKGDRQNPPTCNCPNSKYDGGNTNCQNCDHKCQECEIQSYNCSLCKGDRILDLNCSCPYHMYDDGVSINCLECQVTCETCEVNNGCTQCRYNRIKDTAPSQEQNCICGIGNIDHLINLGTYFCTTCVQAVITPRFNNDYTEIIVQFYDIINFYDYTDDIGYQIGLNSLCQHIFDIEMILKFGDGVKCRWDNNNKQIIIFLGIQPSILHNQDIITFKQDVLQRQGCGSGEFLNDFYENTLILGDQQLPPSASLILPTSEVTLCQDIQIQIVNIKNDGLRPLSNIEWSIDSTNAQDIQKIQDILNNQNTNLKTQQYLIIPQLTLQEFSNYDLIVQIQNFAGQIAQLQFQINTLGTKGTYANIQQPQPLVFKNYKNNEFIANIESLDCSSGKILQVEQSLLVQWVDITQNNPQTLVQYKTKPTDKIAEYELEKFKSVPGNTYKLQILVQIENQPQMKSQHFVEYLIEESPLSVYIEGGNRLQAYANPLELLGEAKDIDVQISDQKKGISLSWDCINMMDQNACRNIGGDLIVLQNKSTQMFQQKIFEPYNSFQFTLNGDNGNKQNSDTSIIIVVETDLPVLTVSIPEQIRNQKINKNDNLQMTIASSQDPDQAYYSLIIIYKFEVVATKSYFYNTFDFQIQDIYNNFDNDESEFILRVSVYDPQYFMPSQSSFTTNINFQPTLGDITIIPNNGLALDTIFTIKCQNFYDENQPLTYRYSYYSQQRHYQDEILQGSKQIQVYKNLISDFSNLNQIETILPSGYNDQLLLMISVSDSLGALRNVTQVIKVSHFSENLETNIDKLKSVYSQSQQLLQDQKITQINLMVQEMGQLFAQSDSQSYKQEIEEYDVQQKFLEFKKLIYDDLIQYIGKIYSKVVEDQIMKSLNILQNAGGNLVELQTDKEIDQQIQQINDIIYQQSLILQQLIDQNLLNQGDNKITKKQNSVNEILGKSMDFMDKMSSNIYKKSKKLRILSDVAQNQQKEIFNSTKQLKSTIQQTLLPNSQEIVYKGDNISQQVQVQTQKGLQTKYFDVQQEGVTLLLDETSDLNLNLDTKPMTVYKSSGIGLNNNPFLQDEEFPFKDQNTNILDIDISIQNESDEEEITIKNQYITLGFNKPQFESNNNNNEGSQNSICIQQEKGSNNGKWQSSSCLTQEIDNSNQIKCKCKSLTPATVVDDIGNILENSQAKKVFSDEGFNALKNFKFWEAIIFYIYIAKLFGISILIYFGNKKDIQDYQLLKEKYIKENNITKDTEKQQNMVKNKDKQSNSQELQQEQDEEKEKVQDKQKEKNIILQREILQQKDKNGQSLTNVTDQKDSENQLDKKSNQDQDLIQNQIQEGKQDSEKQLNQVQKTSERSQLQTQYNTNDDQDDFTFKSSYIKNINKKRRNQTSKFIQQHIQEQDDDASFTLQSDIFNGQMEGNSEQQQKKSLSQESKEELKQKLKYNMTGQKHSTVYNMSESEQNDDKKMQEICQSKEKPQRIKIQKKSSEVFLGFHSFFGIYLVYQHDLSRSSRYILYFIRVNLLLALSALFSQQMTQYMSILCSLITSVFLAIPVNILQTLLKQKKKILQTIGLILSIIFFVVAIYVVLVTSALMGEDKANEWTISYVTAFGVNTFMFEPISSYFQALALKLEIQQNSKQCVQKIIGNKSLIRYLKDF